MDQNWLKLNLFQALQSNLFVGVINIQCASGPYTLAFLVAGGILYQASVSLWP